MTSESSATRLGDHVVLQRGTTYKSALLGQPGPYLLGLASIERDSGFRRDRLRTYGGESPEKLLLRPGDLYVSLKDVTQSGDLLGAVARVPPDIHLGRLTQDTVKLEIGDGGPPADYIYWRLRTPQYREYCRAHSMGTTNLSLSRADFLALPVPKMTPSRASLLAVLQALDDKIDSNRRLAGLLEETTATLFRARFVHFVGVEEFEESERARIPRGWRAVAIGDVLTIVGGSTPSTKESRFWNGAHCWATPKDLSGAHSPILLDTERHITDEGVSRISSGLLPPRTVLLSSRAPVGYTAISFVPIAVNQGFIAIPPSDEVPSEFVFFWLREHMDVIKAHAGGTTFAEISKRQFRPLPMIVPSPTELDEFQRAAAPAFDLVAGLDAEVRSLTDLRDALLPKLISGQIRVPDTADPAEMIVPATETVAAAL